MPTTVGTSLIYLLYLQIFSAVLLSNNTGDCMKYLLVIFANFFCKTFATVLVSFS